MKAMVVVCVIAGAIALHAASAKENYRENGVKADTKESFEPIAENVREELAPGGQYEYATVEEKKSVEKKLSEMDALFQAAGSVAAMTQDQKIALFNAQEVVNSILIGTWVGKSCFASLHRYGLLRCRRRLRMSDFNLTA